MMSRLRGVFARLRNMETLNFWQTLRECSILEMMTPIEVANLYVIGFSFLGKYLIGGDLLFDGGMVKTY